MEHVALKTHRKACKNCSIQPRKSRIIAEKLHDTTARKLVESYIMSSHTCNVGKPTISPNKREVEFMKWSKII